ncbi:MAG: TspO/MBR family protein [Pseudomonadota bacterium]
MPDFSLSLFVFIAACFAAAMTGAFFGPGKWYEALEKPGWVPPNWAFPLVWTVLYGMIAAAGWIIWSVAEPGQATVPLAFWALQLAFNALWSPVFFGLKRMDLAMIVVSAMWLAIAATILVFWPISTVAAALMVPYLVWVSIAAALNRAVWRLNPDAHKLAA